MRDTPRASFRALARVDALFNRVYGSRHNPLYHSGAITVGLLMVLLVTGLYLLLFYRLGEPYESVARLTGQAWSGRWIRGVHRFASDAALVAAAVHAFRMYAQRRSWGPRALAWVSGLALLGVIFVSGWTGYVLVWDGHAQLLAAEGARLLDALPIFSEPLARAFAGERPVPSAFFFVMLFAHIAIPLSVAVLLWVHVARVARPVLLPTRWVLWGSAGALVAVAVAWPVPAGSAADLLTIPSDVPVDWFFSFWLPVTERLPAAAVWAGAVSLLAAGVAVPWLTRPRPEALPAPAEVNERTCTGCEQCVRDCPYDAIAMVTRRREGGEDATRGREGGENATRGREGGEDATRGREGASGRPAGGRRSALVARVRTELCTSCGICVGSCPPMAIGPLGKTARDQLEEVRRFQAREQPSAADVVIVGCGWSAARAEAERTGAKLLTVPCVGALHSSTVEHLLRGGAGGVLVVGCPEHDGRTREGVTWAGERLFEGRKADLKERVDRSRLRLVEASIGEGARLHAAARAFAEEIETLARRDPDEPGPDLVALCRSGAATGGDL